MISNIFRCDGLLLCFTKDYRLAVWNPCTGQTRWIRGKPSREVYTINQTYFLGKSRDSFKILSVNCHYGEQELEVAESDSETEERLEVTEFEVYDFISDSWRVLDGITGELGTLSRGVSLKGNTYWFESDIEVDFLLNAILKFDFTTEKLERLSPPFQSDNYDEIVILSIVREEKLALLRHMDGIFGIKIMVSNTMTDDAKDLSWSDFLVVDLGKLLERKMMSNMMSFLVDEENKMVVWCEEDGKCHQHGCRIDIFGDQDLHKQIYRETTKGPRPLMLSYVPSVVQIPT